MPTLIAFLLGQLPAAPEPLIDNPIVVRAAEALWDAATSGDRPHWKIIFVAAVICIVWAVRKFGGLLFPKLKPKLDHPVVAWALPTVFSSLGAVLNAALAGKPMPEAIKTGLVFAFAAVWAYVGRRKVVEAKRLAQETADAEVANRESALRVIEHTTEKGPQP